MTSIKNLFYRLVFKQFQLIAFGLAIGLASFGFQMGAIPLASADSMTPSCGSSSISNHVQEGVNFATGQTGCPEGNLGISSGVEALAGKVVNIFSIVVGVIAVIMVIYGGFRYIISGGDSSKVGSAKNTLIYAIIGLIIVALAQLIVHYVLTTANGISLNIGG